MSNFPPIIPEDLETKYAEAPSEALCASEKKYYPGQNQAQFCW